MHKSLINSYMKRKTRFLLIASMFLTFGFSFVSFNRNSIMNILENVEALSSGGDNFNVFLITNRCYEPKNNAWDQGLVCQSGTPMVGLLRWGLQHCTFNSDGSVVSVSGFDGDYDEIYPCIYPEVPVKTLGKIGYCWEIMVTNSR